MGDDIPSPGGHSHRLRESIDRKPNVFVQFFRSVFGYRKTLLTLFVAVALVATVVLSLVENQLAAIPPPWRKGEQNLLDRTWLDLQYITAKPHSYTQRANDEVRKYIEDQVWHAVAESGVQYVDVDNEAKSDSATMWSDKSHVLYYESNNVMVRINGTNPKLPALLLSAHYDLVPLSYGVTDDGMGVALLLGVFYHVMLQKQPKRTIVFNFNNDEEFGLLGANAFVKHPWFKQLGYFLNLEGTGAGGKAMLFRTTDYGIARHFDVRFPYATLIFQQGFANRLVHSETDYFVYYEKGGLRGLDLAFYRPRDLYHTTRDLIRLLTRRLLWHMMSQALDFTVKFSAESNDMDFANDVDRDAAVYQSVWRWLIVFPVSLLIVFNAIAAIAFPVLLIILIVIIAHHKKNWHVTLVNVNKFPVLFAVLVVGLRFFAALIQKINRFIPNNSFLIVAATMFSVFVVLNYVVLNGVNWLTRNYKVTNHDEKLIVILELALLAWVGVVYLTVKLTHNRPGDDHTGEWPITVVFVLLLAAGLFGLLGWALRPAHHHEPEDTPEAQPLLQEDTEEYGANDTTEEHRSEASSLLTNTDGGLAGFVKTYSYDWWLQFLLAVPVALFFVYNSGYLVLDGTVKLIQESLKSEQMVYRFLQYFAMAWALPYLPFVFKLNRFIVYVLLAQIAVGVAYTALGTPFDEANPLKLRFLQTIDVGSKTGVSQVHALGRWLAPMKEVLQDLPLVKTNGASVSCDKGADGVADCHFKLKLWPVVTNGTKPSDLLRVKVKNNSPDTPFGLMGAEISITAPASRACVVRFNTTSAGSSLYKENPVKTVVVMSHRNKTNAAITRGAPEVFLRDSHGNYIFKKLQGITELALNKLDWDRPWKLALHWVPDFLDSDQAPTPLAVDVACYWSDGHLPAWKEVVHYSPANVAWANQQKGLVAARTSVEL